MSESPDNHRPDYTRTVVLCLILSSASISHSIDRISTIKLYSFIEAYGTSLRLCQLECRFHLLSGMPEDI